MKSDRAWTYWGRRDPFFSAASWEGREATGRNPWTVQDFLALGQMDMADVMRHWTHYGVRAGRCVEVGCGGGRMTKQLLKQFESVLALDVSPDQIELARKALGADASRVTFSLVTRPEIPAPPESCDAFFTCHVLQHLSSFSGVRDYLAEASRVTSSGATICFHLPVPGAHLGIREGPMWRMAHRLKTSVKRLIRSEGVIEYHRYAVRQILTLLAKLGFVDCELRIFPMKSNGDYHSYFFARKK